ncbi:MAG TPA: hypothetical protein VH325_05540 [Bryobacteraceae bacterium]|jgi:predicted Mrr-cat superfamily restriction endonuclease|nr:hypothetical protein [Bryobacteraceae bacterium]
MAKQLWVVRDREGAAYVRDFFDQRMVAIGCGEIGDLTSIVQKEQVAVLMTEKYPEYNRHQIAMNAGQIPDQ